MVPIPWNIEFYLNINKILKNKYLSFLYKYLMDKGNLAPEQTVKSNKEYNKIVESKTNYALTVTFKYLNCKTPRGQFGETMPYLTKLLHQSTIFALMPEWRHRDGSIHAHCIIKIKDIVKWLKQTLPSLKRLGYILVKSIDDELKWMDYMTKEIEVARRIIPDCDFPVEKPIKIVKKKDLKTRNLFDDYTIDVKIDEEDQQRVEETKEIGQNDRARD